MSVLTEETRKQVEDWLQPSTLRGPESSTTKTEVTISAASQLGLLEGRQTLNLSRDFDLSLSARENILSSVDSLVLSGTSPMLSPRSTALREVMPVEAAAMTR